MIPRTLRIRGFLSYQEACEVDFTQIDLACISGLNGAGKSSLLDAITWVLFGEARRRDDSVINSHTDTAEVCLEFDYEDLRYRVLRIRPRGKTTQLEFFLQNPEGDWKPLTEASVSRTQEQIVRTLRLDYETFINASFFLQGKADQFAQQTPGERKRILSSILGLDEWEQYRDTAAKMMRNLEREKSGQTGTLQEIQNELNEEPVRREKLDQLKSSLTRAGELRKSREQAYESASRLAAALEEQKQKVDLLAAQVEKSGSELNELNARLAERQKEQQKYTSTVSQADEIEARFSAWQASRVELEKWEKLAEEYHALDAQRSAPRLEIESERARLAAEQKQLEEQEKLVGEAQKALPDLEKQYRELETRLALLQAQVDDRPRVESDLAAKNEKRATLQTENNHLRALMDDLDGRKKTLQKTSGAQCPTCGKDLAEHERDDMLSDLEKEGKAQGDQYRANEAEIKTITLKTAAMEKELQSIKSAALERESQQQNRTRLETDLTAKKELVNVWHVGGEKRLHEKNIQLQTNNFATSARDALIALEDRLNALGYEPELHKTARQVEQEGRQSEEDHRSLGNARSSLEPLTREIETIKTQVVSLKKYLKNQEEKLKDSEQKYNRESTGQLDLASLEAGLQEAREEENQLTREMGAAQQNVDILAVQQKRKATIQAQIDEISRRIAHLKTLERAFSREGLPSMLIELAIPEIESRASELLDRLSDGSMSIRFDTQKEYKDKKREDKKETLDILISDAAGVREYELYSGGEAFRINFAIRLALSHLLAQRAGARLRTLVIDEGFGSQDAEGRQRLVEAINLVKPDFALILVITHLEELKDSFPNRIEVEKTSKGSRVQVVTE
jgi:DNA repair protein SbcC/Rad50